MRLRNLCLLIASSTMSACAWLTPRVVAEKPSPFNAQIDPACFAPCNEASVAITGDPDSAVVAALVEYQYRQGCEVRRRACAEGLGRAHDAGAIQ